MTTLEHCAPSYQGLGRGVNYLRAFSWAFLLLVAQLVREGFHDIFLKSSNGQPWAMISAERISLYTLFLSVLLFASVLSMIVRYLVYSPWPIYQRVLGEGNLIKGLKDVSGVDIVISAAYLFFLFAASFVVVRSLASPALLLFATLALPVIDTLLALLILLLLTALSYLFSLMLSALSWLLGEGSSAEIERLREALTQRMDATKRAFGPDQDFFKANLVDIFFVGLAVLSLGNPFAYSAVLSGLRYVASDWPRFCDQLLMLSRPEYEHRLTWALIICIALASVMNYLTSRKAYANMFEVLFRRKRAEQEWLESEGQNLPD